MHGFIIYVLIAVLFGLYFTSFATNNHQAMSISTLIDIASNHTKSIVSLSNAIGYNTQSIKHIKRLKYIEKED